MADSNVRTYDPKQVIITFGPVLVTGYAAGSFVRIAPSSGPAFEKVRGADGGIDRTNKNSNDYIVTITVKKTSPTNDAFSRILAGDKLSNTGKLPLIVKDLNGTTLHTAPQAWITDDPEADHDDAMPNREWVIETGIAVNFIGGNN
jgi:hypothetical protein